ncbi:MAG TPA: hypothetical protein VN258_01920 [Mobilitalea sp.]|nr:hypothetical protein [Mobilitalea sp.]
MNNEDKILEILQTIQNQICEINNKVDGLSDQIAKVEIHLENVTDKSIGLLMEQYNPNIDRIDNVAEKVEEIQFDVSGLKRVVISHSKDINNLMKR